MSAVNCLASGTTAIIALSFTFVGASTGLAAAKLALGSASFITIGTMWVITGKLPL